MRTWNGFILLLLALPSALCNEHSSEDSSTSLSEEHGSIIYPYGYGQKDLTTTIDDDGGTDKIIIKYPFRYYGEEYDYLYVNNNGGISFKDPVTQYTPDPFPIKGIYVVAPLWADVDNEIEGLIYYRQTTKHKILKKITKDIQQYFPDLHFKAVWCFIVTWHKVAYYGSESNKTNTFQAILTTDLHTSIVMFNYDDIQWTTGTASGGDPQTGLGGTPAQAGFNTDEEYFSIPGSRTRDIVNIKDTSNVGVPGRWVFQVDNFSVPGGCKFEASFMQYGQSLWKDKDCTQKCTCKHSGKLECEEKGCDNNLVCMEANKHFMCQIDEENC